MANLTQKLRFVAQGRAEPDSDALKAAADEIDRLNNKCDHLSMRLGEVIAERDKLRNSARFAGYFHELPSAEGRRLWEQARDYPGPDIVALYEVKVF
jgi:hypothetical protein